MSASAPAPRTMGRGGGMMAMRGGGSMMRGGGRGGSRPTGRASGMKRKSTRGGAAGAARTDVCNSNTRQFERPPVSTSQALARWKSNQTIEEAVGVLGLAEQEEEQE